MTMTGRKLLRSGLLGLLLVLSAPVVAATEADLGKIVEFIRWGGVIASVPVVIIALFMLRMIDSVTGRLTGRFPHLRLTIQKVQTALRFLVYTGMVAVVVGLSIRLDATAMTVIGGALAFAVGFAMRDLVASFIAGITIIFDRPFQVGDRVSYAGEYGDIVKIGLRSVRMMTLDHNLITIPNNKVFTDITSSGNYGELEMQVPMDFHVGIDQDLARAQLIVREACLSSPYVFLGRPVPILVQQVIINNLVVFRIKARPYVFDCRYEKAFETDVHLRVAEAFRAEGIRLPALLRSEAS